LLCVTKRYKPVSAIVLLTHKDLIVLSAVMLYVTFTAELVALNLALDIVWHSGHKNFVIFSDSQLRHFRRE